jgi:hypothetical protein
MTIDRLRPIVAEFSGRFLCVVGLCFSSPAALATFEDLNAVPTVGPAGALSGTLDHSRRSVGAADTLVHRYYRVLVGFISSFVISASRVIG